MPAFWRRPMILQLYLGLTRLLPGVLTRRARKAHTRLGCPPERMAERLGRATRPRPNGKLIWLHAASVGELLSALDLARDLHSETRATLLFTTMTQTSAALAEKRLPAGAIHQFMPIDTPAAVQGFLDHWHPDLACFVESDIWPRLVLETHTRGIPLALINARPSSSREKSPKTMGYLMSCFTRLTAQDDQTRDQLLALGLPADRISTTGDLKAATAPLEHDPEALQILKQQIKARPIWLAASTHPGEEEQVLDAHKQALAHLPDLLLILAPRHPERGAELDHMLTARTIAHAIRSQSQPITDQTQVYLADTLGELGLLFTLAPITFMGASFTMQGGHNPFEPAQLGTAILHGPHVRNFQHDYAKLDKNGAAQQVNTAGELAQAVIALTNSPALTQMQDTGQHLMADMAGIRPAVLNHLRPILP
ncbi:MAG: 3-deoxy-D-manno-octulosonic acid transferase [Thalassovita sp.]